MNAKTADLRTGRPTVARMGMNLLGKELVLKSAREPLTIRVRPGKKTTVKRLVQVKQVKGR